VKKNRVAGSPIRYRKDPGGKEPLSFSEMKRQEAEREAELKEMMDNDPNIKKVTTPDGET